jgi:hypothetical protein
VSLTILASPVSAADAPPQPTPAITPATETRVYDVRDLTLVVADYPLSGALVPPTELGQQPSLLTPQIVQNGAATGGFSGSNPPPPPPKPIDNLIQGIVATVDPTSWKIAGGSTGQILSFNGELLVTQTPENLKKVDAVLSQLRSGKPSPVRVRADWIVLQPGKLDELLKNGRDDKSAFPEINRDALDKLSLETAHYMADISCFSGETVHLASGRSKSLLTESTPVVGQATMGYEIKPELVQYGVALQVMPVVSGDSATLDLKGEASEEQKEPTTQPLVNGVDRLNAVVQHFHTTVQVPLNKPVLLEGATVEPSLDQPQGAELYLIVEADAVN